MKKQSPSGGETGWDYLFWKRIEGLIAHTWSVNDVSKSGCGLPSDFCHPMRKPSCSSSCWVNWRKIRLGICKIPRVQQEGRENTFFIQWREKQWFAVPTVKTLPCFFLIFSSPRSFWKRELQKLLLSWIFQLEGKHFLLKKTDGHVLFLPLMNSKSSEKTSLTWKFFMLDHSYFLIQL